MMRAEVLSLFVVMTVGCVQKPPPPVRAVECNMLCVKYIEQNDLTRAEVQADLGLQFAPEYADLWVCKGLIALKREQRDKAKDSFIKAIRYNQEIAPAYNNLGYLYLGDREYGKAHDNLQRALRIDPDYLQARYNLALAYEGLKQVEKAKKEYRTLIELNPALADPHAHLGKLYLEEGESQLALEELQIATRLDPNYIDAWLVTGNVYMELSKPCDAKDAYGACIEVDSENPQCRNNIILAEKKCQLQSKALNEVNEREKTPQAEFAAALASKEKGLVNDEERAYRRCLRYDGKFARCHFGLFTIFKERRDQKNAVTACKNFVKYATGTELEAQVAECERFLGAESP